MAASSGGCADLEWSSIVADTVESWQYGVARQAETFGPASGLEIRADLVGSRQHRNVRRCRSTEEAKSDRASIAPHESNAKRGF